MENERKMYQDMERIFFTKEQIAEAVKKLGASPRIMPEKRPLWCASSREPAFSSPT